MLRQLTSRPFTFGIKNLFNRYSNALIEKPYKTKMLTAGVLAVTGDAVCQLLIEKRQFKKNYDFRRTVSLGIVGGLVSAPLIHLWYMRGAPAICHAVSNNTKLYPFISMVADQTLISTSTLALFLFLTEYLKDFNVGNSVYNVQRKFKDVLITNYKVWPPLILFNFLVVPPHFRVFFCNFMGFFWGIYLSYYQFNT